MDETSPEARLIKVDEALTRAKISTSGEDRAERWLMAAMAVAIILVACLVGFLLWSNTQLTEAVADKNQTIGEVRHVLTRVDNSEQRSQCYFTLIAERSLVTDPELARQMAIDYLEGRRCPAQPAPELTDTEPTQE